MTTQELADLMGGCLMDYLNDTEHYATPVMIIGEEKEAVVVRICDSKRVKRVANSTVYDLKEVCIADEFKNLRPYYEGIEQIAQQWLKDQQEA